MPQALISLIKTLGPLLAGVAKYAKPAAKAAAGAAKTAGKNIVNGNPLTRIPGDVAKRKDVKTIKNAINASKAAPGGDLNNLIEAAKTLNAKTPKAVKSAGKFAGGMVPYIAVDEMLSRNNKSEQQAKLEELMALYDQLYR